MHSIIKGNIFWIIYWGYVVLHGLFVSFSQEMYDDDIKKSEDTKLLYRKLFGKFAPFAVWVPYFCVFAGGLIAWIFPQTTLVHITLAFILIFMFAYMIWFHLFVSKHKSDSEEKDKQIKD